ncbi:srg family chemoreceptor domain-containing protein [Ditylenchus destructor]|uniref:Serpentine receptor class gamma n=1 Tax=Ditylenchus destructor TaxID=166010 RepID=A0AAD4QVD3_9BILA|nr:srg family chemoreceptor domain-containing protein [Ditylenchus destructor]
MYARFGRVGLFYEFFQSSPSLFLAIWFTFYYYAFHAENLTTMFILINRLTSILFPLHYIKIWKHLLPLSVMVIVLVPLPFTAPMLTYGFSVRLQADNYTFTLAPNKEPNQLEPSLVSAVSAIIFCVICGALNIATLIVYNLKDNDANRSDKWQQKIESKLTIYALITFIGHLFMALYMHDRGTILVTFVGFKYNQRTGDKGTETTRMASDRSNAAKKQTENNGCYCFQFQKREYLIG